MYKINRKGFTLVELLMVIVLIGILFVIAVPAVLNFANNNKSKLKETKISLIKEAAIEYGENNPDQISDTCSYLPSNVNDSSAKCNIVTTSMLYLSNYITGENKIDPKTNTDLTGFVEIQKYYNRIYAVYVEQEADSSSSSTSIQYITNMSIKINNDAVSTTSQNVTLQISATNATEYCINTSATCSSTWTAFSGSASVNYTLASGTGTKTVYALFRNSNDANYTSDSIVLSDEIIAGSGGDMQSTTQTDTSKFYAYKSTITSITFDKVISVPTDAYKYWDISKDSNSKVMAYIKSDGVSGYNLHIQANGKTYAPVYSAYLFNGFYKVSTINNIHYLDTSKATNMSWMMSMSLYQTDGYISQIKSLDLGTFNTANVTDMHNMFTGCGSLTFLNVGSFSTTKVTDMSGMFSDLYKINSLNIGAFNTSSVVSMASMFWKCYLLESLDLSSFITTNVTQMLGMFFYCSSLKSLDLSTFNTSLISDMGGMFAGCSSLTSLNVSSFNTSRVKTMQSTFDGCSSLTSLNLSSFNTAIVTNMYSMFRDCSSLTSLNLNSFNTGSLLNSSEMFSNCSSLNTLNIKAATFYTVTNYGSMFFGAKSGMTIYVINSSIKTFISDRLTDSKITGTIIIN